MACCPALSFFGAALSASVPMFVFVPGGLPCTQEQQQGVLVADTHSSVCWVNSPRLHISKRPLMRLWRRLAPPVIVITADAVHGVVLEAFPADQTSMLICTPRVLHELSLFVFLALLGGITSATSSLPEEEACGFLSALVGVPSCAFSFGWVFLTRWPPRNSQPHSQLQSGLLLGRASIPSLPPSISPPSPALP